MRNRALPRCWDFLSWVHSLVRPAPRAFFRPDRRLPTPTRAEAVKVGRHSAIAATPALPGRTLTASSTAANLTRSGLKARRIAVGLRAGVVSHCTDEVSCRMFLCSRCRSQVLVCRQCDRGQIYCTGPCAQEVRRDNQRQARRRYQATPRGRTMHAERSRQYRARRQRVTDHGPATARKEESLPALRARTETGEQLVGIKSAGHWLCHCCGQPASAFLRLSALRPEYHRRNSTKSIRRRS